MSLTHSSQTPSDQGSDRGKGKAKGAKNHWVRPGCNLKTIKVKKKTIQISTYTTYNVRTLNKRPASQIRTIYCNKMERNRSLRSEKFRRRHLQSQIR